MNVRGRAVFADALDAGILVHKAGGNNAGGDGHHADAKKRDEYAENLSHGRNGINVAVAHGEQRGHRPPDAGKGVGEHLRLRVMLQRVHTKAGGGHQHKNDEYGAEKLLGLAGEHLCDNVQGIVIGVDAEQAENADHPEHPECHGPGGEEPR